MSLYNKFKNEISLSTVRKFYARKKGLFDVAVDAVVRGCVNRYNFDNTTRKYFGTVTTFDGSQMYKVEIALDHSTGIKMTACDCHEDGMCYHIGALALHSGYDGPIFSYTTDDSTHDSAVQPFQEVYVKSEILDPAKTISNEKIKIEKSTGNSTSNSSYANISFDNVKIKSEISVNDATDAADLITNDEEITDDEYQKSALICEKCDKIFDNKFQFEVHQRYSHKNQVYKIPIMFQCVICSSRKQTKQELEIHMKYVHQNKECNECGLFFLTSASKNKHFRTMHLDKMKFCCDECPRYYFTERGLYLHKLKNIHYQFRCTICDKAFNRVGHYNRHIRGVHGLEPSSKTPVEMVDKYECKICSVTFPSFVLHHKHLRNHPTIFQTFKCSICGKGFETKKARTAHEMCHRSRLHECKFCHSVFDKESDLDRHCKEAHLVPPQNQDSEIYSE